MPTAFTLAVPPGFQFLSVIGSHGWPALAPFSYEMMTDTLHRVHGLASGRVVHMAVRAVPDGLHVTTDADLSDAEQAEVAAAVRRILNMDADLSAFYALTRAHPPYAWAEARGAGRMLVAPTVWEDLAKTLLTTNTTWSQTRQMTARLNDFGSASPTGARTFPTPQQLAALTPDVLNAHVRAGYRGASLHALADAVASGALNPEAWRDPALTADEVYRQVLALKGFGPYAAGSVLRLLNHHDRLSVDTVMHAAFARRVNGGVKATEKAIHAHYAPFGRWRGLVSWLDVLAADD